MTKILKGKVLEGRWDTRGVARRLSINRKRLSFEEIEEIEKAVVDASDAGDEEAAWDEIQPLLRAQKNERVSAISVLRLVEDGKLSIDHALTALEQVESTHSGDKRMLGLLGKALAGARNIDELNEAKPSHPVFQRIVDKLACIAVESRDSPDEENLLLGLAQGARMMARQRDEIELRSHERLIEIDPKQSSYHFFHGLFFKTRGRFSEGMEANRLAASLVEEVGMGLEWNLGICATGAGEGALALESWKRRGHQIEMGNFGLPEGPYPDCKVKLAQRPLAERSQQEDDPGLEETIWIERLSPCHGIIRSVLYQDLGVDYGDVILFDGAPIMFHKHGERQVPVFPQLTTLMRNNYAFYHFAGIQDEAGCIDDANSDLDPEAVIYPHSECFMLLCSGCWQNPDVDHEQHKPEEQHVVTGKIAAPRSISPKELLDQLDKAMASRNPCRIYVPELCEEVGLKERAVFEKRRFEILVAR